MTSFELPAGSDDYVNPDPACHRPGSEFGALTEEARGACMECSWFEDGVYVPWPCSVIEPNRRTVAGIATVDDLDAYVRNRPPTGGPDDAA